MAHQRFALRFNSGDPRMFTDRDGDWIRWEDHQKEVTALHTLMQRFLAYLESVEGSDFVDPHDLRAEAKAGGIEFTEEEWNLLRALHNGNQP